MTQQNQPQPRQYNLEERTARFAEDIIHFLKNLSVTPVNKRLIEQLAGSSGSIGANYSEATEAESKKDFIHKMSIAIKEIKETKHWIRLIAVSNPEAKEKLRTYWQETDELLKIFSQSIMTAKR